MSTPRLERATEEIYEALDRHAGNKSQAAKDLGIHRQTLKALMDRAGISDKPMAGGQIKPLPMNVMPLPPKGQIQRYIVSSAQNNTKVHSRFVANLLAYKNWLESRDSAVPSVPLMISRFMYNKTAYNNHYLAKPGRKPTATDSGEAWYDAAIEPYVCDDPERHGSCRYQLAPDLQWRADANISPTAHDPLSGRQVDCGTHSGIFPHTKHHISSQPHMQGEKPRFLYSTGTVTQMNYIQRNEGQKAEFHHVYSAMLVEVNSDGDWWARNLNADCNGCFYDCPGGQVVKVNHGQVTTGHRTEGISWGDVHASEIDPEVAVVNWGTPDNQCGAIDALRPKYQTMHDLFSMRSQSHHDRNKFGERYRKWFRGEDIVLNEVDQTRDLVHLASRDFCQMVVVNSNHDRHGERWLDEADFKVDLPNARFYLLAQLARLDAIEADDDEWTFLEWAMRQRECPPVRFLRLDESLIIGPRNHPIECGLHGDLGPNGSRGSTRNLANLGRRNTKGHDHTATVFQGTYSAGVCQLKMRYAKGPSSWSISHVLTYLNGKRAMLTQRAGKLWA
jgi:hypothetical protein